MTPGQVYLLMYGTGIRHASSVTVTLGSQTGLAVAYAGAQGYFVGEDQINVLLPPSLAGAGVINVTLTADGQTTTPSRFRLSNGKVGQGTLPDRGTPGSQPACRQSSTCCQAA